jgi:hypothetical protein
VSTPEGNEESFALASNLAFHSSGERFSHYTSQFAVDRKNSTSFPSQISTFQIFALEYALEALCFPYKTTNSDILIGLKERKTF